MKTLTLAVTFLLAAIGSLNADAATLSQTRTVKKLLSPAILAMEGVNGIGIGACDQDDYCVLIRAETAEAAQALQTLFPEGTQIEGVTIAIYLGGRIVPQPRMTGGN